MRLQPEHLATLLAIVDTGTFDAAARQLHVTPSAVSQRVKALEAEVGRVVVVRTSPCRATAAGEALVRLARQQSLLESEALAGLAVDSAVSRRPADRRQRRLDVDLVRRRADRGGPVGRRRAARPRRGPGPLGPAAPFGRGAGCRDLGPDTGPGLLDGAARDDALPAGGDAAARRAPPSGPRFRLGCSAPGALQRQGRHPAAHPRPARSDERATDPRGAGRRGLRHRGPLRASGGVRC